MKGFENRKLILTRAAGLVVLLWAAAAGTVFAEERAAAPDREVMASAAGAGDKSLAESLPSQLTPWSLQGEYYWGMIHNRESETRFWDGCWAGIGAAFPSYAALQWQGAGDRKARISVGLGELYNGREAPFSQPAEDYYETPLRSGALTAGKFYVPFALQEWEYETRYGLMYGSFDFAFARLSYAGAKRITPHAAVYRWKDRAEEFGTYHTAVVGVSYAVTPYMALEGGYGSGSDKSKWWLQAHWTFGQ
ncbi:MAG: hypothetical protein IT210_22730 [Armatimonadetes bacterium]|nr:hypothetical protein [Armatimonadota bacterium]